MQFRYLNNGLWSYQWPGPSPPQGIEISLGIEPLSSTNLLDNKTNNNNVTDTEEVLISEVPVQSQTDASKDKSIRTVTTTSVPPTTMCDSINGTCANTTTTTITSGPSLDPR